MSQPASANKHLETLRAAGRERARGKASNQETSACNIPPPSSLLRPSVGPPLHTPPEGDLNSTRPTDRPNCGDCEGEGRDCLVVVVVVSSFSEVSHSQSRLSERYPEGGGEEEGTARRTSPRPLAQGQKQERI